MAEWYLACGLRPHQQQQVYVAKQLAEKQLWPQQHLAKQPDLWRRRGSVWHLAQDVACQRLRPVLEVPLPLLHVQKACQEMET